MSGRSLSEKRSRTVRFLFELRVRLMVACRLIQCLLSAAWRDARRPAFVFLPEAVTFGFGMEFGQRPFLASAEVVHLELVLDGDDQNAAGDEGEQTPPRGFALVKAIAIGGDMFQGEPSGLVHLG
jgi:hypothetical protein